MSSFLLLNPDFFFDVSGPAQKAVVLVYFFGVDFMTSPPPPKIYF
jgi:hypothetical protein